jgi:putative flavoprotein involved in K+ transport
MRTSRSVHVIIIGAGLAGIAAAACLSRAGISYTIFERGGSAFAATRLIDPGMILLSPMSFSKLPGMRINIKGSTRVSFGEYFTILKRYQEENDIHITTNAEVVDVQQVERTFSVRVRNSNGSTSVAEGTHVINATGIISHRRYPDHFDPTTSFLRWKHSIDVRSSDLQGVQKLLVVGGGNSSSEILTQWLLTRSAQDYSWLSLRSRLFFVMNPILGFDIHYFIWLPEHLPVFGFGELLLNFPEPILGRQLLPAIRNGLITQEPAVRFFEKESVVFENGQSLKPDLVVFATGFRYDTSHLGALVQRDEKGRPSVRACESRNTPRLFLLGLRFGRTFASQYIRGIARDAQFITKQILKDAITV